MSIEELKYSVEKISGGTAIKVCDYDQYHYLFVCEGANPYYIVNKNNGNSLSINPLMDFDRFSDAIENRVIKTW
jgi:hypothetical protein